jgi:hypothetical protein
VQHIRTRAAVRIDPATLVDYPLSKERIAVYNSGLVPIDRYERDSELIAAVNPESLRIDLGWGAEWMPWTRDVVSQASGEPLVYDFEETDRLAKLLNSVGARPYWSYCYVPKPARPSGGDWRTMDIDDSTWVRTVQAYVAGMRARGVSVGYHEVYNEPDHRDERTGEATFYTGQLEDYLELYRATATAIRAASPTARVGGPALALPAVHEDWIDAFLAMVRAQRLPLDFLSFHHYGHWGLEGALRNVRDALARYPDLRHVELHLNEYNAFPIDYPRGGLQDTHHLASAFGAEISRLLSHRELTRTHWAQFLDSGHGNFSGMIDIDGARKPIYRVYEFYQRMPIDRVRVVVDGPPGLGALASATEDATAAIVWNRHFHDLTVDLTIGRSGTGTAIIIDGSAASAEVPLTVRNDTTQLTLRPGAVALLRLGQQLDVPGRRRAWGLPVVSDHALAGWSDVDEATATFRFGSSRHDGWMIHGADLLDRFDVDEWEVAARTADGSPAPAAVSLRHLEGDTFRDRVLSGSTGPAWDDLLPDRPQPDDSNRVFVAVAAAPHTFVRVSPRGRS